MPVLHRPVSLTRLDLCFQSKVQCSLMKWYHVELLTPSWTFKSSTSSQNFYSARPANSANLNYRLSGAKVTGPYGDVV